MNKHASSIPNNEQSLVPVSSPYCHPSDSPPQERIDKKLTFKKKSSCSNLYVHLTLPRRPQKAWNHFFKKIIIGCRSKSNHFPKSRNRLPTHTLSEPPLLSLSKCNLKRKRKKECTLKGPYTSF